MKILTTLNYYHPHWTGLTVYAQNIAEGLVERGHEVTVLTSQHEPSLPRQETVGGVNVVRLPVAFRLSRAMLMPSFPLAMARLVGQHDVVHIHSPSTDALLAAGIARLRRTPVVVTHQGDVVMPAGAANRVIQGLMQLNLGGALRLASAVTTHAHDYARHSRFLAPVASTIAAIHPPTLIPVPQPRVAAEWRASLGAAEGPLVGFAGRFVEEKGFDLLLQAIPLVRTAVPDVRFVFAGETNVVYEHFFERWQHMFDAHDNAHDNALISVGLLRDRQRLADFYAMCDLFVLPSRSDCFAGVQVEALLCGTPLLTADIPGAREVVHVSGMGRLAPANDPVGLAEAIIGSLRDPLPRPTRAAVEALFDADVTIDRYEQVLRDAVRRVPPAPTAPVDQPLPPLAAADAATLAAVLRNEADTAYRRRVPRLMEYLQLSDDDVVLDCGCGMGYLSTVMGELRRPTIIGIDGNVQRLEWARRERVPAVLSVADILRLPFAGASFDKVLLSEVLEHLTDDDAGLRELWRVLKPGGVLALSVPHANYPFLWDPINKTRELLGVTPMRSAGPITGQWSNHERLYLPGEVAQVASRAGFEVTNLEEQTHHVAPFHHVLVYSIGKPLIEHGLLPPALRTAADRFSSRENSGNLWNPVNLANAGLRRIDRRNDHRPPGGEASYVSLLARLRKPGGAAQ